MISVWIMNYIYYIHIQLSKTYIFLYFYTLELVRYLQSVITLVNNIELANTSFLD